MDVAVKPPLKPQPQPKPVTVAPVPAPAVPAVTPTNPCHVQIAPDGSAAVTVYISPETLRRYKLRAQNIPLDKYLFDNVLRAALESHVY